MSIELRVFLLSIVFTFLFYYLFFDFLSNDYYNQFLIFLLPLIWPGIAHGSLDLLIAKKYNLIRDFPSTLYFIILYVLLAFMIVIIWYLAPNIGILLFLVISIIHFGTSDTKPNKQLLLYLVEVLIRGLMPICIPIFFFSAQVNFIFLKLFVTDSFYVEIVKINVYIFYCLILLITILFFYFIKKKTNDNSKLISTEIILIFSCFTFFEPLISFCLYFCFMHSLRHLIDEKKNLGLSNKQLIFNTLPITGLTLLALIFCYFFINFDDNLFKFFPILFISLASLTVPHMLLISWSKTIYSKN